MRTGASLHALVLSSIEAWRKRVFHGIEDYSEQENAERLGALKEWLSSRDQVLEQLAKLEQEYGFVSGGEEIRRCYSVALQLLADWTPPARSMAIALRALAVGADTAAKIQSVLAQKGVTGIAWHPARWHCLHRIQ